MNVAAAANCMPTETTGNINAALQFGLQQDLSREYMKETDKQTVCYTQTGGRQLGWTKLEYWGRGWDGGQKAQLHLLPPVFY